MLQRGENASFDFKSADEFARSHSRTDQLERHTLFESALDTFCEIHDPESAATNFADDPERADLIRLRFVRGPHEVGEQCPFRRGCFEEGVVFIGPAEECLDVGEQLGVVTNGFAKECGPIAHRTVQRLDEQFVAAFFRFWSHGVARSAIARNRGNEEDRKIGSRDHR